ncbi:Hypothetical_protein [Hexamita inflata]|uniref:Hypothetical_protein n=1 Tax=Hexamita inflata TaxID=28002 RepID=A0AA86N8H7_9EUKA|nr:Hypothetical protein HINF_LOCUS2589 [Hexamita inflata]
MLFRLQFHSLSNYPRAQFKLNYLQGIDLSQDQELMNLHILKPQSYKQVQGDAFELSPESIAQFYFVDTKIGIAMIIQYTKKYKLDKQDVEWAKLAAPKINNAKNMNDIIQIINE